jgi:hypothetical protein
MADSETSRYYTLQSNASRDMYPNNAPHNFRVHLPSPLQLPGQWVVGLADILFPCKFMKHEDNRKL